MLRMTTAKFLATIFILAQAAMAQGPQPGTFEVASVKPAGAVPAGGGRGTSASGGIGLGCDGGFPKVDNGRFSVITTPYALIAWAYGYNRTWGCSYVSYGNLLTGGPAWIRSERFEIQATIPEGSTAYTLTEFMKGDAPGLEKMLQGLLADRFKLVVHKETKQVSAYALTVGKGGSKLTPATADERPRFGIRRESGPNGQVSLKLVANKIEMRDLAFQLLLVTQRPVIDRTGLKGQFNFEMEFAPLDADASTDSGGPSLFTAIQKLGLTLETTKAPLDGLVIDSADRPAEN